MRIVLRAALTAAFFLCALVLAGGGVAHARQQCAPLATWEKALGELGETKTAVAEADGKNKGQGQTFAMIWYESPAGSWTQLVVGKSGLACHIASGQGGIDRIAPPVKQPVPSAGRKRTTSQPPAPPLTDEGRKRLKRLFGTRSA